MYGYVWHVHLYDMYVVCGDIGMAHNLQIPYISSLWLQILEGGRPLYMLNSVACGRLQNATRCTRFFCTYALFHV